MHVESIIFVQDRYAYNQEIADHKIEEQDYEGWVESIDRSRIQSFQQMRKDQIR
ncbi:MAG: hypothetical protein PHN96_03450 [Eubacteriales bacterium]|nr:hypothetical protein [Eubacteriales bacterium]